MKLSCTFRIHSFFKMVTSIRTFRVCLDCGKIQEYSGMFSTVNGTGERVQHYRKLTLPLTSLELAEVLDQINRARVERDFERNRNKITKLLNNQVFKPWVASSNPDSFRLYYNLIPSNIELDQIETVLSGLGYESTREGMTASLIINRRDRNEQNIS